MKVPRSAVIWLGAAAAGVWAIGAATNVEKEPNVPPKNPSANQFELQRLLGYVVELNDAQRAMFIATAKRESNFSPLAHNDSASERAASAKAAASDSMQATVQWAVACGVPRSALDTGSWTMFQFLAPYIPRRAQQILGQTARACNYANPTQTRRPFQIVAAMAHARALQGYTGFTAYPTVGNLMLGWGSPGRMGYLTKWAAKLDGYKANAAAAGLDPRLLDEPMPLLPDVSQLAGILARLEQVA